MANESTTDVLMKIVGTGSSLAMEAENLTDFEPLTESDQMVSDFKPGQFCELRSFDFSAGAENSLSAFDKKADEIEKPTMTLAAPKGAHVARMVAKLEEQAAIAQTARERLGNRERGEFVDMQEVSYTRILDSASPLLFKALTGCTTLASISIVKRKASGTAVSGLGYLRLDFKDVLMTGLQWDDVGHVMIETGSFIYRKLTIKYLSQKADGSLVPGSSADWKMKMTRTGS